MILQKSFSYADLLLKKHIIINVQNSGADIFVEIMIAYIFPGLFDE